MNMDDAPPPYSETDLFSNSEHVLTPATSIAGDHVPTPTTVSGAAAYFEARPMLAALPDTLITHSITLTTDSKPAHFSLPDTFKSRDVTEQDWLTFLNYLMPHHCFDGAEAAKQKYSARLATEHRQNDSVRGSDIDSVTEPLDRLSVADIPPVSLSAITDEWNRCFFTPRGVFVRVTEDAHAAGSSRVRGGLVVANNDGFRIGQNMLVADNNGFRMGKNGLVADNDGFRIGNFLVADNNGFRLGNMVADNNGFRIGGRVIGGRPPGRYPDDGQRRVAQPDKHSNSNERGRNFDAGSCKRDSSTSSSSSSSSSDSDSIMELPEWDHWNNRQLEVTRDALNNWLNHPEYPASSSIKQLKNSVRQAKNENASPEANAKALRQEIRALLKECKKIQREHKLQRRGEKRVRRAEKRAARRERRNTNRETRRALKEESKAVKRAMKDEKRQIKAAGKQAKDQARSSSSRASPYHPDIPRVPTFTRPQVPNIPSYPPPHGSQIPSYTLPQVPRVPPYTVPGLPSYTIPPVPPVPDWQNGQAGTLDQIQALRASAARISHDAAKMQEDADRTKAEAKQIGEADPKTRLKLLDVADSLKEEIGKLLREAERLRAEADHIEAESFRGNNGQSSGVTL